MPTPKLTAADVGAPRLAGTTTQNANRLEITAGGEDIWGTRDEFHFAHFPVAGDFSLTTRVESLVMADVYTKAGIMFRASLAAGAPHALLLAFGDNQPRNNNNGGLEFQSRLQPDAACTGIYPPQPLPALPDFPASFPNVWLRLQRTGNSFTGRYSQDGVQWKTFCTAELALPAGGLLGFAVTSHNPTRSVQAVFTAWDFSGQP